MKIPFNFLFFPLKKSPSIFSRFFGLIFLILIITGCNNNQVNSSVQTITFWHGINPPENRQIFDSLVAKFNQQNPNIQVESLYIGQPDEQLPKILASVANNQPPDVLWYVPQLTGQLVKLDAIKPLENWLNQSQLIKQIDPAMRETMQLNDHLWSVPMATNNAAIFYRPSLFQKAGIKNLPTTYQELKETAKKLTKDNNNDGRIDQNGILLSLGKGEWNVFVWLPFIFSSGGEIVENNQPSLVNDGTIKALQFARDLVTEKAAILSQPERGYELDDFILGKVAMQVTGPWTLAQLKQSGVDYNVFPIPKDQKNAAVVGGENLFVFKTNPEKEAATLKFLEYIISEDFQTEWALKTGYLPININAQNSSAYQAFVKENPVVNVFLNQMKVARSRPIIQDYPRLSESLGRAIESSLLGQKTPQQALEEAQKRLQ
jgi:multiple sugar transport system substrate-binding protein